MQQAKVVSANVSAELTGRSHKEWKHDYIGDFLSLGRSHAALTYRGIALEGRAARRIYEMTYTALVPTKLRKLLVLRSWLTKDSKEPESELLTE